MNLKSYKKLEQKPYDKCLCQSGQKYKFCCKGKVEKQPDQSNLRIESFNITLEALKAEQFLDGREEMSPEDKELYGELFLERSRQNISSENDDYFFKLKSLIEKYPHNPSLWNELGVAYLQLGKQDKVREIIILTYQKFPNYLFGMIGRANLYVQEEESEKFREVFKGKFTLKQLYPDRDVFHIDEVIGFYQTFFQYYCVTSEFDKAESLLLLLKKVCSKFEINEKMIIDYESLLAALRVTTQLKEESRIFRLKRLF